MNRFPETRDEFAHYNFIEKTRLKKNSTGDPQKENSERSEPGPPAAPGADAILQLVGSARRADRSPQRGVPTMPPFKECNARQEKRINNRPLDQHCSGQQCEDQESIPWHPRFLFLNC